MFSTELSIDFNEQAGAWLNEHDSVTYLPTWVGPNRALPVGPSGCEYFKNDCAGSFRRGRVGADG